MKTYYEILASNGTSPEDLASIFLSEYFPEGVIYPVNPFQILTKLNVAFTFRNFGKNYEGFYIPSSGVNDTAVVGLNIDRPITRQRFTAAHELCHHLKDSHRHIQCDHGSRRGIEKYADRFAAALLMPLSELTRQAQLRLKGDYLTFDDVLDIAQYFGVSFQCCLNHLAWDVHVIDGNTDPLVLHNRARAYQPERQKEKRGYNDTVLFSQLINAVEPFLKISYTPRVIQKFKTEFVFHDSRIEGVKINQEKASEIILDLRLKGAESIYYNATDENLIEVAGLVKVYDYVFTRSLENNCMLSIYDVKEINRLLYSLAPFAEFAGNYRQSNAVVTGSSIPVVEYSDIPDSFFELSKRMDEVLNCMRDLTAAQYLSKVLDIHHRLTVVHPFNNGNGRSIRAFTNLLLLLRGLPPVLFEVSSKRQYKNALAAMDEKNDANELFIVYVKHLLLAYDVLTDVS